MGVERPDDGEGQGAKTRAMTISACLAVATAAGVAIGMNPSVFRTPAVAETVPVAAAAAPAISLLDVMNARSPGTRGRVHLLTKVKASPLSLVKPRAPRSSEVIPAGEPFEAAAFDGPDDVGDVGPLEIDFSDLVETAPVIPNQPPAPFYPVSQVVPLNPMNPPVMPVPPATAVPEPATWAMLLIGFAIVGAVLRRRKPGIRATFA